MATPGDDPSTISLEQVKQSAGEYSQHVSQSMKELDQDRVVNIPQSVESRRQLGEAYLTWDEVYKLTQWKLKHEVFRPNLLTLVGSNSANSIRHYTAASFRALAASSPSDGSGNVDSQSTTTSWKVVKGSLVGKPTQALPNKGEATFTTINTETGPIEVPHISSAQISAAMDILTVNLRGIGPATASLLLSMYAPHQVPFFSHSFYRWIMWSKIPGGWKAVVKYSKKAYMEFCERAQDFASQWDGCSMLEMEKAAYTIAQLSESKASTGLENQAPDTPNRKRPTQAHKQKKRKQAASNDSNTGSEQSRQRPKRKKP